MFRSRLAELANSGEAVPWQVIGSGAEFPMI
jgi:hypothetical protein